jgi:hypothetical protein
MGRKLSGFRGPVEWMLGPELLGRLRQITLHTFFSRDLDLRDWMHATSVARYDRRGEHAQIPVGQPLGLDADAEIDTDEPGVWFDYIADTGDSQLAMYSVACMVLQDLHVPRGAEPTAAGPPVAAGPDPRDGHDRLPRGRFLILGGDTAYHVADVSTLRTRLILPFGWAIEDLGLGGEPPRQVYAIPGNHDYYDQLVGFNRMFRVLVDPDPVIQARAPTDDLPGYTRTQDASYFRIVLPWGWEVWGLDPGRDRVDVRQAHYFRAGTAAAGPPPKRILCTPAPAVVHERVVADPVHLRSLARVAAPAPFLAWGEPPGLERIDPAERPRRDLGPGECQLDLSGDVHHYARYGGGGAGRDDGRHYASVVAGLGGAFHHPTFTRFGDRPAAVTFPGATDSRREVVRRLANPWTILKGGMVKVVAGLVALTVYAGSWGGGTALITEPVLAALGVPTPAGRIPADGWRRDLVPAIVLLAAVGAAVALIAAGVALWKSVARQLSAETPRRWIRLLDRARLAFAPSFLLFYAAPVVPYLTQHVCPARPFHVVFIALVALTAVALVYLLAYRVGAADHRRAEAAGTVGWGVLHAAIQLTLPLAILRAGPSAGAAGAIVVLAIAPVALRRVYPPAPRISAVLWIAQWLLALAAIRLLGGDGAELPEGELRLVCYAAAFVVGAVVGCQQFGWYLLVAAAWNAHNNEAGSTARIDRYQQIVRIQVTPDRLTGWVIGVAHPEPRPGEIAPDDLPLRLIDTFSIEPRRPR